MRSRVARRSFGLVASREMRMIVRWSSRFWIFGVGIAILGMNAAIRAQGPAVGEIRALRTRVDEVLRRELVACWYPRAIEEGRGGFHQNFARDWSPLADDTCFSVYQARMTWTAAAFARYAPDRREEFAKYARHGIEFIDRRLRDRERGGFHWILGPGGELDAKLGDEKHVYGTAFVLYAASEARAATGDELALKVGRDAFDWLEKNAHDAEHGGYFEALTRAGKPIVAWDEDAPVSKRTDRLGVYYGFKSMNSHIHLLEAIAAYARVDRTPLALERLKEMLIIVRDKIAIEPGALNLYFTRDWRAVPAHDSFGHDVEAAYLIVEAAEAFGIPDDEGTWRIARMLVDHALDWGWDQENGGFYDKGDAFAHSAYDTKKVWWTQAEGLNSLLLMHHEFGAKTDRYWKAFIAQWNFIEKYMIDKEHGGWFAEVTREGRLTGVGYKANQWKANYHASRALMNVARILGELSKAR